MDLSISCHQDELIDLKNILKLMIDADMDVVKTNKSISVRLYTNKVDFRSPFFEQLNQIDSNLEAINRLYDFSNTIEKLLIKFTN